MKKVGLSLFGLVLAFVVTAQTTVNATNIIGRWMLHSIQQDGMFSYETKSQKVLIDTAFASALTSAGEMSPAAFADTIRVGLANFGEFGFEFFKDGKSKLHKGAGNTEDGTYTVNEKEGTLTSYGDETGSKEIMAVIIINGLLEIKLIEPEESSGMTMRFLREK